MLVPCRAGPHLLASQPSSSGICRSNLPLCRLRCGRWYRLLHLHDIRRILLHHLEPRPAMFASCQPALGAGLQSLCIRVAETHRGRCNGRHQGLRIIWRLWSGCSSLGLAGFDGLLRQSLHSRSRSARYRCVAGRDLRHDGQRGCSKRLQDLSSSMRRRWPRFAGSILNGGDSSLCRWLARAALQGGPDSIGDVDYACDREHPISATIGRLSSTGNLDNLPAVHNFG